VIEDVNAMKLSEEEFSENYEMISTNSENLPSNFSFVINKDITLFKSGRSNSVYKPAFTLYYPRTRDEFEVNIYIVQFSKIAFASSVADVYAIIRNYENIRIKFRENNKGQIIPSAGTTSVNRAFVRADTEDPFSQSFYSVYSFENMAVIIDAHVQKEYYKKYEEDIKQIRENFKFLKPFILENHVEEYKNDTFSYLYPKGWNLTNFMEATKDTAAVDGIRPWGMSLRLNDSDAKAPHFTLYTYNIPFYRWENVHDSLPIIDMLKNESVIVSDNVVKRNRLFEDGEISAWEFLYSWTIKENNLKIITIVSFLRLKDTNKIAVFVYDNIDIELNYTRHNDKLFRASCIGESAEFIIFATLTSAYAPYFADKFYLE